jgi:hypothetical protein
LIFFGSKPKFDQVMSFRDLKRQAWLLELGAGVIIILGCVSILRMGAKLPEAFRLLSLPGRNALTEAGGTLVGGLAGPLAFSMAAFGALSCPQRLRRVTTLCVVLVGFSLALAELWGGGASTVSVVGGLLPNSDARDYVIEGARLTEGKDLTQLGSSRPLTGAYMAAMLWLSGGNLQVAVSLLGLFTGASFALLLIQSRRQFGGGAAAIAFFVLFLFYRRFLGSTACESCGITFGALGLALLLDGFERRGTLEVGLGSICLVSAFNARPGAFFVLPCLVLAIIWHWRGDGWRSLRVAAVAVCCMAIAAEANVGVFRVLGTKEGVLFSNLGIVLYGTIHGGNWTLAYEQHPELLKMPEGRRAVAAYKMVWEDVRKEPSLAWTGAIRAWGDFSMNRHGPFSYVPNQALERALLFLAVLGIAFAIHGVRGRSDSCLVLCATVGVAMSLPFAPAWDSDNMRAYAVTIPLFAIVSGSGATALCAVIGRFWHSLRPQAATMGLTPATSSGLLMSMAATMLLCLYLLPVLVRFAFAHQDPPVLRRTDGHAELTITIKPGNLLRIVPDTAARTYLPDVRQSDFLQRFGYYGIMWHEQADYLRRLVPHNPMFIIPGSTRLGFIVVRQREVSPGERIHLRGQVHNVVDGDFFVEDGLP